MMHEDRFYKELLDTMADGVYFVDTDRRVTFWNKAAERISGYAAEEVVGRSCADSILQHVDDNGTHLCTEGCPLSGTITHGKSYEVSIFMHHKYGHRVPVFVRASPMRDENGAIVGAVEVFADNSRHINVLKEVEALRQEVLTDPLTCVGNRRYADITMQTLDQSMSESSVPFGVIFVDIDHFKDVNDTWGHDVGDQILQMVARTLHASMRPLDVICRWGGEEFVLFISNTTMDGMAILADRLRMLVQNSWLDYGDHKISVTASFGGAISRSGEPAADVVTRADANVYLSKYAGRNCVHISPE